MLGVITISVNALLELGKGGMLRTTKSKRTYVCLFVFGLFNTDNNDKF